MRYELYYWDGIQGRGEYVRLALEEAGADYRDVAREPSGSEKMMKLMRGGATPAFAPPFLKAGKLLIGQTANILLYLGERHGLAPKTEAGRLWTHQIQLTISDFVVEIHDVHHPIGGGLYYEDQKPEAKRRAADFLKNRAPKYLDYFKGILDSNRAGKGRYLVGGRLTYADLSLFQIIAGMRYAFPNAMRALEKRRPGLATVHDSVAARPRIAAYLESERRLPFNQQGIFRHYPELDAQ
ncbi:MAG TPA: glutathione S-transferase [Candidatus Binatia bacterium]|nr:glutathione S-transferase [Candidatus Binatia bacterium]